MLLHVHTCTHKRKKAQKEKSQLIHEQQQQNADKLFDFLVK